MIQNRITQTGMLLRIAVVLLLVAFGKASFGQSDCAVVKGKLTDRSTGEGIPFANVMITLNNKPVAVTATNFDGEYVIKQVPYGIYDIEVRYIGYTDLKLIGLRVDKDVTQDLRLTGPVYLCGGHWGNCSPSRGALSRIYFGLKLRFDLSADYGAVQPKVGRLKGRLIDASTRELVSFVNIRLLDGDKLVASGYTNGKGEYHFKEVQAGEYSLEISKMGYKSRVKTGVKVLAGVEILDLKIATIEEEEEEEDETKYANEPRKIAGKLIDEKTGKGLPFADVALMMDDKVVKGTRTDGSGEYVIEDVPDGMYSLLVEQPKHTPLKMTGVDVDQDLKAVELTVSRAEGNFRMETVEFQAGL